jgi:hypothetical protein
VLGLKWLQAAVYQLAWWQSVLLIATAAGAYIFTAAWIGSRLIVASRGWAEGVPTLDVTRPADLEGLFARWDSGFYLQIVLRGYAPDGWERAFFPLYPMLVRGLSAAGPSVLWSGLLVSCLSFVGSALLLYKWLRCDYSHGLALLAVATLAFSPFSFFLVAFYAESLFLLLSFAGAYFARRGWFVASGLAIGLAGAARPQAFLLVIPLVAEFWRYRQEWRTRLASWGVALSAVPLGSGSFTLWLATQTQGTGGSLPYLGNVQGVWKTSFTWPWVSLFDGVRAAVTGADIQHDWFSVALVWHDLAFAVLGIGLAIWAVRRIYPGSAVYLWVGLILVFATHGPYGYALWSDTRRVFTLFPIYVALALVVQRFGRSTRFAFLGLSTTWLGVLAAWFASGRWVA